MSDKGHVYAARLLRLAELLEALPRKRFNFTSWVGDDWRGASDLSCGTTACALGWATTIPSLRRAGLRMARADGGVGFVRMAGDTSSSPQDAVKRVFGMDEYEFF